MAVLQRFANQQDGDQATNTGDNITSFPLFAYQYVIRDFLEHGYYVEREVEYSSAQKVKIHYGLLQGRNESFSACLVPADERNHR